MNRLLPLPAKKSRLLRRIIVHRSAHDKSKGWLIVGQSRFFCALGRSGISALKREGDGATPRGLWPLRRVFFRADRLARPVTQQKTRAIRNHDAWCDNTLDRRYNRLIGQPAGVLEERLMRQDALYDIIVELGFNDAPIRRNHGSAIFLHVARPAFAPTAGCVAIRRADFAKILPRLGAKAQLLVR